jgi:hypothetical protein
VPTTVLLARRRVGTAAPLLHLTTERVTYRLLAPTNRDAGNLLALVDLATDGWVRMPRWEDQSRLSAAA